MRPTASTPSRRLRAHVEQVSPPLRETSRAFWESPSIGSLYPSYLEGAHGIVRAAVPLMETAIARLEAGEPDALTSPLIDYFRTHAEEETGHLDWLDDDLRALGVSVEDVQARAPSGTVAGLVGAQHYWIEHHHPVALLGYFVVLEGNPTPVAWLERLSDRTGIPRKALTFLIEHARSDVGHERELDDFIDTLPLQPAHLELLETSIAWTVEQVARFFRELLVARRETAAAS
ncbi:MAG: iron-containing redox enzyme family protein [Acidobacteriota bacterium]